MKIYVIVIKDDERQVASCVCKNFTGEYFLGRIKYLTHGFSPVFPHNVARFYNEEQATHFQKTYKQEKWTRDNTNEHGHVNHLPLLIHRIK